MERCSQRGGDSFLVLQDGDLIRQNRLTNENNVVDFETYALDLSQLGAPNAASLYRAKERSTLYLLEPRARRSVRRAISGAGALRAA